MVNMTQVNRDTGLTRKEEATLNHYLRDPNKDQAAAVSRGYGWSLDVSRKNATAIFRRARMLRAVERACEEHGFTVHDATGILIGNARQRENLAVAQRSAEKLLDLAGEEMVTSCPGCGFDLRNGKPTTAEAAFPPHILLLAARDQLKSDGSAIDRKTERIIRELHGLLPVDVEATQESA